MDNEQNKIPTTPTPEVTPTTGVDLNVYGKSISELASVKPTDVTAQMASDPYNKAAAVIEQISNNANNQIAANSRETIGTDRGGQRALLTGANDTYMTRRYSSPVTASLAGQIRAVAAQAGLNAAMNASLARSEEAYNNAKKAAQKRAAARAAAAAAAAATAQSQQMTGTGGVEQNPDAKEETNKGDGYTKISFAPDIWRKAPGATIPMSAGVPKSKKPGAKQKHLGDWAVTDPNKLTNLPSIGGNARK